MNKKERTEKYLYPPETLTRQPLFIAVKPDGSDIWRLKPVTDLLKEGGVGIIPTDSMPAVVCDVNNYEAVRRLYMVKHMNPKKPLSLLCRGFGDIGTYTTGFPVSNEPGVPDTFAIAKRILPGPYTLILPASKNLPKQMIDYETTKLRQRKSVGIRWPNDVICQAVLDEVQVPLIASSIHGEQDIGGDLERTSGHILMERYGTSGIDFVVSVGHHVVRESTIIDMTERVPSIIREGSGEVGWIKEALSF